VTAHNVKTGKIPPSSAPSTSTVTAFKVRQSDIPHTHMNNDLTNNPSLARAPLIAAP
jgi:hypothetical protein